MKTSELHIVLPGNFSSSWIFNWMTYYLRVILPLTFKTFSDQFGLNLLALLTVSDWALLNITNNFYKWLLFSPNQWKSVERYEMELISRLLHLHIFLFRISLFSKHFPFSTEIELASASGCCIIWNAKHLTEHWRTF